MKIITVVPVSGRETLLKYTISRMVNQAWKVICVGHTESECTVCEAAGADFYYSHNAMRLGMKWQHGVDMASVHSPDAILIMGSASMISDNWIETLYPDLEDYAMTGAAGIHYLHYETGVIKLAYWEGYKGARSIEPIGVGRMVSSKFLIRNGWRLFNTTVNSSLDHSAFKVIKDAGGNININRSEDIYSIRISSDKWANKNGYYKMARMSQTTVLKDYSVLDNFPELKNMKL